MFPHWGYRIPVLVSMLGACSVYDPSLLASSPIVGGAGEAGVTGVSGSGSQAGRGGAAGKGVAGTDEPEAGAGGSGAESGSPINGAGTGGTAAGAPGAGSAGVAGAAGGSAPVVLVPEMIDDMEDDDASIDDGSGNGRTGDWYAGHDTTATGTQFPGAVFQMSSLPTTDSRYDKSKHAAMTNGMGFTTWGSNLGVNMKLVDAGTGKHPTYDASAYCGLHFYARVGAAAGTTTKAFLRVIDKNALPEGGTCSVSGGTTMPCYQYFQKVYTFGSEWQEVSVLFSDLMDEGWPTKLLVNAIFAIEFGIPQNTKFELWVDDLAFLKKPASGTCPASL